MPSIKRSSRKRSMSRKSRKSRKNNDLSKEKTLFVFFSTKKYLDLPNNLFPAGWWWVGSGGTNNDEYPSEMQFSGPEKNKSIFYNRLNKYFKTNKNVERYLINSKHPQGF
jgi:hypothetical protein